MMDVRRSSSLCVAAALGIVLALGSPGLAQCDLEWTQVGPAFDGGHFALEVLDDGSGLALYAGGYFTGSVAKWNGAVWTVIGPGLSWTVRDLILHNDGTGPALYAGGNGGVAKFNGKEWEPLPTGVGLVHALSSFDDGSGPALYAGIQGGTTDLAFVKRLAANSISWTAVGSGPWTYANAGCCCLNSANAGVYDLHAFDVDGEGSIPRLLYAAGQFGHAPGAANPSIAAWNGSGWSDMGAGLGQPGTVLNDFAGLGMPSAQLIAASKHICGGMYPGGATTVESWQGTNWTMIGNWFGCSGCPLTVAPGVNALAGFDDDGPGPEPARLYEGGLVGDANPPYNVARWNGGSSWSPPPAAFPGSLVNAMAAWNDGPAPSLYVSGHLRGWRVFRLSRFTGCPGACCLPDGACRDVDEPSCVGSGGVFQGADTTCVATRCPNPCPADIDGNGTVNVDDLLAVINSWGACAGCAADINDDGTVNVDDLLAVINAWGRCP
jgi:hypothetical protein